jgi:hypothetical protein
VSPEVLTHAALREPVVIPERLLRGARCALAKERPQDFGTRYPKPVRRVHGGCRVPTPGLPPAGAEGLVLGDPELSAAAGCRAPRLCNTHTVSEAHAYALCVKTPTLPTCICGRPIRTSDSLCAQCSERAQRGELAPWARRAKPPDRSV